jgi:anaerobic magnesium-protoporphyrin IX monomethyl ester cyclase
MTMSEILFGQSYYLRFDPKLWNAMQPYPPLGTLYAASYLRKHGYQVALFDAMLADSEQEWAEALDIHQPRFAVIYEDNFNYLSKMCLLRMRQAAFTMIEMAKRKGCTIILCGSDASDHAEEYLKRGADFVLIGEGEVTLAELVDALTERSALPIEEIAGLAYNPTKTETTGKRISRIICTPRRPDIRQLDDLPFPAWDLVDIERYRRLWIERHGHFSMNMVTTRGCPYHCNWCAKPIWGQRYNSRSPENVVAEMKWLKETYRPDHIAFVDDILGLKPGWLTRFADLLEHSGAAIPFKCLSRVDLLLRPGEIEALRWAGCQIVWVGAESGSQKILEAMEKGTRVEQIQEASRRLHQSGIRVGFFLQFGYPGETREDIRKTFQLVRECAPDDIGMSVSYPLPGTKFYERVQAQLAIQQNWIDSKDMAMLYQGPFPTRFYRKLHIVLHSEFQARRNWRKLITPNLPGGIRRRVKASAAFLYHLASLSASRLWLELYARLPHRRIHPLTSILSPGVAAQPSPPNEGAKDG